MIWNDRRRSNHMDLRYNDIYLKGKEEEKERLIIQPLKKSLIGQKKIEKKDGEKSPIYIISISFKRLLFF